ncbi:MAG: Protein translocase subunit SecA [Candidatus Hydrogenedentota bacterium]
MLTSMFGTGAERDIQRLHPVLDEVNRLGREITSLSNDALRAKTAHFKEKLSQGATLDDILPEAYAVCREAAKRVLGLRHFDVQIIGGMVLHQGNIAEMVTGEGKTLVATLPTYLNALTGAGVHVVTVNDYLARRDKEWMAPIYEFLGLTTGLIQQSMSLHERQVGYRADITYGTNNEFGFDYLRDNLATHPGHRVQRGLNYAIVDEVDSILIDEARTPLIISGRPKRSSELYYKVDDVVRRLRRDEHFTMDEKQRHILLSDEGMELVERGLGVGDLYTNENISIVHMVEQSLKAHNFFKRDKEYMVRDGEVFIVDEFTGRVMEGRRYSDGLHQALEAKERVPLRFESQTVASITYQNYFRLYKKLAGMTGTAMTEANEFAKIYNLEVFQIPTNLPLIREDLTDLIFATELGKFRYVIEEIKRIREEGRPILVGTVSIEKSELVAQLLAEAGINDFQVLNAKHHEREAAIVANAGKMSAVTVATNMAGRGTDIKLAEGVRERGGLYIIGTERHESRRIDNQLRGRCGRQGDPGTTRFYVSLEDEVARLFGGNRVKSILNMVGTDEMDAEPLSQRMVSRSIERAQRQVEEYHFESRKHVLEYDEVMDKQRKYIYAMRSEVLEDRDVTSRLHQMIEDHLIDLLAQYAPEKSQPEEWDLEGLEASVEGTYGFVPDTSAESDAEPKPLLESLRDQVIGEYHRRESALADEVRAAYREQIGGDESKIDFAAIARKRTHDLELMIILKTVDDRWVDHLYEMDQLRDSVRLRAFGQRDPLLEYKQEGYEMFQELVRSIEEGVLQTLFHLTDPEVRRRREAKLSKGQLTAQEDPYANLRQYQYVAAEKESDRSFSAFDTGRFDLAGQTAARAQAAATAARAPQSAPKSDGPAKPEPVRVAEKINPNDVCPCGSGKKYKKCCGKLAD